MGTRGRNAHPVAKVKRPYILTNPDDIAEHQLLWKRMRESMQEASNLRKAYAKVKTEAERDKINRLLGRNGKNMELLLNSMYRLEKQARRRNKANQIAAVILARAARD